MKPAPTAVGFFGGSFNPPHVAHVLSVTTLLRSVEGVDRVLVVPTYMHPFAKALAPFDDRVRMCELAMGWIPGVEVSRVEETLGGESRTLRTIEHLASAHPDWNLAARRGRRRPGRGVAMARVRRDRTDRPARRARKGGRLRGARRAPAGRVEHLRPRRGRARRLGRGGAKRSAGNVLAHIRERGLYLQTE